MAAPLFPLSRSTPTTATHPTPTAVPAARGAIQQVSTVAGRADGWVIRAWVVASSILLALFGAAVIQLGVKRSRWKTTAESGLDGVLVAHDVGPAVVGFLRPRIVLPSWALSVDARMRALLLKHELERLRAGDTRMLMAAEFTLVVFPWNAALWWMVRRLRLAVEMDCDARVIRAVDGVYEYATMLLAVGERYAPGCRSGRPSPSRARASRRGSRP